MTSTLEERLLDNIWVVDDGCWIWTARVNRQRHGYGMLSVKRPNGYGTALAHRVSYETYVGPIPPGFHVDHLCRKTICVNPRHLEAVTPLINLRRSHRDCPRLKTHCVKGHAFIGDNVVTEKRGQRACKTCVRAREKARCRTATNTRNGEESDYE